MKVLKINISLFVIVCIVVSAFAIIGFTPSVTNAKEMVELEEGVYDVPFDTNASEGMGMKAFENSSKTMVVEKIGNTYYATVSFDATVVKDIEVVNNYGKVGDSIKRDGDIERHTITLSYANINKDINFSVSIIAMDKTKPIRVTPLLSKAVKRSSSVNKSVERLAEYLPVISVVASDNELEKGSTYVIPEATASITSFKLTVLVSAYYLNKGERVNLDTSSGSLTFNKVGEYHINYHAESDKYKTSLGNNTSCDIDIKILVKVGATSIVKVADNNILPENFNLQSSYITEGSVFENAKAKMKKIADNFEVISFDLLTKEGENIDLSQEIGIFIKCNEAYNKNEVEVYRVLEDGSLKLVENENYGRYVKINTNEAGTFIVCQPGVAFVMPMWGYALITVFGVIILITVIVVPIVVVKKKKKKEAIANGTYVEKPKKRLKK